MQEIIFHKLYQICSKSQSKLSYIYKIAELKTKTKTIMKILSSILITIFFITSSLAQNRVTLSGKVTDFNGNPIDSALVRVMDRNFKVPYLSYSDRNGFYSMEVEKGNYNCVYATKVSEYRKTKLEYWAWNVPIFDDIEINPQYNNMEIYGIKVIEPVVTPYETYMIYFRPMSLKKIIGLVESQNVNKKEFEKIGKVEQLLEPTQDNTFNIAPNSISEGELSVKINDIESKIVNIQRVKEFARGMNTYGYFIQVLKPVEIQNMDLDYDKISIVLNSTETNEIGDRKSVV